MKKQTEIRIPIKNGYLIWNNKLMFGEDTTNKDLWNKGYGFGMRKILGIKFIVATRKIEDDDGRSGKGLTPADRVFHFEKGKQNEKFS